VRLHNAVVITFDIKTPVTMRGMPSWFGDTSKALEVIEQTPYLLFPGGDAGLHWDGRFQRTHAWQEADGLQAQRV
jgi:hypothetical protein